MSKQQSAGAIALTQRVEALERMQADHTKRIDALLAIIEKQSEQLNKLVDERPEIKSTYQPAFDCWPGTPR